MAKKNEELSVPSSVTGVKTLDQRKASQLITKAREEGHSIQHDLFPSLNKALVDAGPGSCFAGIAVGDVVKDAMPSNLNPDVKTDTLALRNLNGEKEVVMFYASNGGAKAKLSGIKKGAGVLVVYRGDKKADTKGFNDWHDYGIEEFPDPTKLVQLMEAAEA